MSEQFNWIGYFEQIADKINQRYQKDNNNFPREMFDAINEAKLNSGDKKPYTQGRDSVIPTLIYSFINKNTLNPETKRKRFKLILNWLNIKVPAKEEFHFAGVPSWTPFKDFTKNYSNQQLESCWKFLDVALRLSKSGFRNNELKSQFENLFDQVFALNGFERATVTIFLFYICPDFYVPLDTKTWNYLNNLKISELSDVLDKKKEIDGQRYLLILKEVHKSLQSGFLFQRGIESIPELSYKAYTHFEGKKEASQALTGRGDNWQLKKIESKKLIESMNIILRGAPGTGKTHLAKQIAADIISNGQVLDIKNLDESSRDRFGFVQFHPSYDYTDFVEGLRPVINKNKTVGFELQDGIFKAFVEKARKEYEKNPKEAKPYVFVIDEINRGEISKIFGELFFAIDPGYRGTDGSILTQYANLHADPKEKFYIPENVYIIGTMNDIDRSVDSFDFAMRRRFRFIEIKAEDTAEIVLSSLPKDKVEEAKHRMKALNQIIADAKAEGLGTNYQIGAAYFLKLAQLDFEHLWSDYLEPLLSDYVRGMPNESKLMGKFKDAYEGVRGKPDEISSN